AGADVLDQNFTNMPPVTPTTGSISGYKINDINGNGTQDPGENGLAGWTIELRLIGAGKYITKETTTDANGFYRFDNLSAGVYLVREKQMKGYRPSSCPVIIVSLADVMNSENNSFFNVLNSGKKPIDR
ncbi:MAG: SpaA isopeptide-forming pilin-related protein, partial [ANME-2 cluster archaeon]|nr:SpaA isopeptide-forming pilin-related protein [ANME-2 cluster archaeon]